MQLSLCIWSFMTTICKISNFTFSSLYWISRSKTDALSTNVIRTNILLSRKRVLLTKTRLRNLRIICVLYDNNDYCPDSHRIVGHQERPTGYATHNSIHCKVDKGSRLSARHNEPQWFWCSVAVVESNRYDTSSSSFNCEIGNRGQRRVSIVPTSWIVSILRYWHANAVFYNEGNWINLQELFLHLHNFDLSSLWDVQRTSSWTRHGFVSRRWRSRQGRCGWHTQVTAAAATAWSQLH